MAGQSIEIIFGKKGGTTKMETHGFQGAQCVDASKFINDALGFANVEEEKTAAYYEQPREHVSEHL